MRTSELLKIPNTDNISTEYIEMELKKKNITDPIRWALVHTNNEKLTISIAQEKQRKEIMTAVADMKCDIKDINLADLKSFINKSYMIPYYGCNVFFNKEGLSSRQNIEWFIKNKSSDYLQYIVDKNFNK